MFVSFQTILLVVLLIGILNEVNGLVISTDNGKIHGITQKSRDGRTFYSFRGIRYAKAPIGNLRFEPPQEYGSWNDTYDATKNGKMCPQISTNELKLEPELFSEDCLILNIYTNELKEKRPVMIFIHGGSFVFGGSHSEHFLGPEYLMDKDIVLVTLNYRLGVLGFITTGTKEAPGNLAFKDQVMAFKWVQKHIHNFGGDSQQVTLVGYSAGSNAASLHLVSSMSHGLFHRIILMGGTSTTRIPALNQIQTKIISDKVGCQTDINSIELIKCLRKVPYQQLIEVDLNEFASNPIRKWNWVVEEDFGQERFLEIDANKLFREGRFPRIPIMIGTTSKEFLYYAKEIISNETLLSEFNYRYEDVSPICFLYERQTKKSIEVSHVLKFKYFNNEHISENNLEELGQLFSDGILRSGLKRMIDRIRKYQQVYLYSNSYKGRYSFLYNENNEPYGMVHADDLLYLFTNTRIAPIFKRYDPENSMVERMINIWTNFATKGIPEDNENNNWIKSNATIIYWNEISDIKSGQEFLDYLDVWDELFPETE